MSLPDYIIVGIQKSATTFVHETLRSHPEIYAQPGEVTVFRDFRGYEHEIPHYFSNLIRDRDQKSQEIVGIKFPEYLADSHCATSIKKVVPHVKFIAVLRNPIERIVSAYYHYVSSGLVPLKDINQGLPEIMQGKHFVKYPKSSDLVEYGFYFKHLRSYLAHFGMEQFLILLYEDVRVDPVQSLKNALKFLGVDNSLPLQFPKRRLGKTVSSIARLGFHRWRNPILYDFDYGEKKVVIKNDYERLRRILFWGTNFIDRNILSAFYKNEKPKLSNELASQILEVYIEDIISLERLLGMDLSKWKTKPEWSR